MPGGWGPDLAIALLVHAGHAVHPTAVRFRVPYLDHAATTLPKPLEVVEAMRLALGSAGNPGRGGHGFAARSERLIDAARRDVASLLGEVEPSRVVFTLNGTDALNIAIHAAIDAAAAGGVLPHVVTTVMEHNSVSRPLRALANAGRVSLDVVDAPPSGVLDPARIAEAVRPDTALVAFTMASNALGTLQPVEEIVTLVRARSDALVLVDAAQTVGSMRVDVRALDIDLLAAPGHKALMGPMGTGILWIGSRAMPELGGRGARLGVYRSGGTGGDSTMATMPSELPYRFEAGTPNVVGIAGLGAGVRWVLERRVDAIRAHEQALIQRAIDGLSQIAGVGIVGPRSAAERAAIVCFSLEGHDPLDVAAALDSSFDVAVRAGLHCAPGAHRAAGTFPQGTVRLSVGGTTKEEEIDAAVQAIRRVSTG